MAFAVAVSALSVSGYAFGKSGNSVPAIVNFFENVSTGFVSVFSRAYYKLFAIDEENIAESEPSEHSWVEVSENATIENPDMEFSAEAWVSTELSFTSSKEYADPFNDVDISLVLFGNGRQYTIPGFWAGNNVWKIRFVCPSAGVWYFKTVCTDTDNKGLHNMTGKVSCGEYSGELEIYKHGFVTTEAGKKYFTYADGTPFFYLGDTHWTLMSETPQDIEKICKKRAEQGFTVYQTQPMEQYSADYPRGINVVDGVTQDDMADFEKLDACFKAVADCGFVNANAEFFSAEFITKLIECHGGFTEKSIPCTNTLTGESTKVGDLSDEAKEYLERLSRYWVARYSSYPVMWTLGQECDNDGYWEQGKHSDWSYVNNPYLYVAEYIDKYDAYDSPLSAHQEYAGGTCALGDGNNTDDTGKIYNEGAEASAFRNVKSHTWYAAQWTPNKTKVSDYEKEKDYWYNSQGKPVVNYEGQYCGFWTGNFGSRMQAWSAYLNGMCGYGWGGQGTWAVKCATDYTDGVDYIYASEGKEATFDTALELPSSYQSGYAEKFLTEYVGDWWNLVPRFDNKSYFMPSANVFSICASNSDNSKIALYFYSFSDTSVGAVPNGKNYSGVLTGTVGNLKPFGKYKYIWFNPITGEASEEGEFTASVFGTYYIGERQWNGKSTGTDMVFYIYK